MDRALPSGIFTQRMAAFDRDHLWHPYARMRDPAPVYPVVAARGVYLELADGRRLIDGMSSWWAAIHGYNHPTLNAALAMQMESMSHVMFGGLTHAPAVELGQRLLRVLPPGLDRLFFCDSGSVAVEVAIKMALQYWQARGQARRRRLLTVRHGYHGDTFAAMSVCDPEAGMHHLFRHILPQQIFVEAPACGENCDEAAVAAMEAALSSREGRDVAAVIIEPVVQGAGGMRIYGADYLTALRRLCDRYDTLLVFDEIATGFGRTGKMFACEHPRDGTVRADIMCVGKSLGAGYLSLAAVAADARVADAIDADEPGMLMHGPTYMANPLACAIASANLDLLATGEWRGQVAAIESQLAKQLEPCRATSHVNDVRVKGAIGVVEMRQRVDVADLCRRFVERGVWVRPFANLVYVMPPYVIAAPELRKLTTAVTEIVRTLHG